MKRLSVLFFITITHIVLYAQVNVELKDRIKFPEVYFWKHLHDTILVANEGYNFSNFAVSSDFSNTLSNSPDNDDSVHCFVLRPLTFVWDYEPGDINFQK
jgi:hypothetical protein